MPFFRRPSIKIGKDAPSAELLKAALREYHFELSDEMIHQQIAHAPLDDLDLIEALELVEKHLSVRIESADLANCGTFADIIALLERARAV